MRVKRIFMVLALWIWLGCMTVFAEEIGVQDYAELFTSSEISTLEADCKALGEKEKLNIFIFTEYDAEGSGDGYLESIYEYYSTENGVMFYISMNPRKMYVYEYSYDNSSFRLDDDTLHDIELAAASASQSGTNFMAAASTFLSKLEDELPGGFLNRNNHFVKNSTIRNSFIICVIIGGVIVLIMYFGQRSSKVTDGRVYMKPGSDVNILEQEDIYTHTTKEVITHESSSSSGGGGGGGGHSGGGASF